VKTVLRSAVLMSLSAVVALVLVEGFVRIWKRDIAFQPDPELIRSLRPNVERDIWSYDTPEVLASRRPGAAPLDLGKDYTNNLGLRMKEDVAPQSDEHRILLFGDSFVEAEQLPDNQRFYALAQRTLDEARGGGRRWRIINAGIQNGAPSQYVLQATRYLDKFHPEVVLVFLAPNDSEDDFNFENRVGFEFDARGIPTRPVARVRLWLLQKSWTLRYVDVVATTRLPWLYDRLWPNRVARAKPTWSGMLCGDDADRHQWFLQKTGRYLAELKRMTEARGARFGVVMIHYMWEFGDEPSINSLTGANPPELLACQQNHARPYREFIHRFLQDQGMLFDDPYDVLLSAKTGRPHEKLWHFYDYHFSPAGHRLIATELLRFLRQQFMVSPAG
jgi:hypothetical protein